MGGGHRRNYIEDQFEGTIKVSIPIGTTNEHLPDYNKISDNIGVFAEK